MTGLFVNEYPPATSVLRSLTFGRLAGIEIAKNLQVDTSTEMVDDADEKEKNKIEKERRDGTTHRDYSRVGIEEREDEMEGLGMEKLEKQDSPMMTSGAFSQGEDKKLDEVAHRDHSRVGIEEREN